MSDTGEYYGLYRASKQSPWQIVCRHADYADCWGMLLDAVADRRGRSAELLVSRTVPGDGPRRRPAR